MGCGIEETILFRGTRADSGNRVRSVLARSQFVLFPHSQALREQVKSSTRNVIDSRQPLSGEFTLLTRSGETLILHGRSSAQCDEHGHLLAVVGTVHDITRRKQIEAMASAEAGKYRQLFENSLDGVMQTQTDGKILAANPAACDMFGCTESQLITMGRNEVIDPKDERLTHYLAERELTGKFTGELRMLRLDGTLFDAEITSCVYQEEGSRHLTSLVIRDISERKMHEREIERLAFTDGLTGLPNRRLLFDRGTHAIAEARRSKILGALLFIDLDHFKVVNDAVGHATGDALLCEVAERLRGLVREGDTVARLGGDEFVILLTGLARTEEEAVRAALLAAERIRQVLETPFVIETRQFSTGASIGISLFPNGDQTYLDVLREADTAMYRAKAQGRHRAEFFVGAMQREVEERFAMEHALERAIRSEGLFLVAQSQFDAQMQQCGVELLLRWNDENGMPVPPAKFIPLAENLGLINVLGEWVIEQGCKSLAHLQGLGLAYSVSVNVSPRQFHQPDFVARVSDALMRHRITPGQLIFEVTENLLIDNVDEVIDRMERLTQLGIKFSIDDFGTGYSSLAYLQKLPLYELKIDKIFLRDLPSNKNNAAIVHLILDMAGRLGLRVVAEGVENADQFDFLVSADCRSMQGFMLAKPLALAEWLAQKTKDAA
jgi:diguanylate cyclase (GGDEF)-like protein/PAS domain S-box-containing protein